jgi:hypothetical protein
MLKILTIASVLVLAACSVVEGIAAPRSELASKHWLANDPASAERVDHAAWDRFLADYLVPGDDGVNRFAYARAKASGRALLDSYIASLEAVRVSRLERGEQRAYWINLYNAVTTRIVLDHYPVKSIRDISLGPGLFSFGPWDAKVVAVEGERLSLNDIEHGILRPIWHDPRLHYALNCASISCPSLPTTAFTAANTERLLDAGARLCQRSARRAHRRRHAYRVEHLSLVPRRFRRRRRRGGRSSEALCRAGAGGGARALPRARPLCL